MKPGSHTTRAQARELTVQLAELAESYRRERAAGVSGLLARYPSDILPECVKFSSLYPRQISESSTPQLAGRARRVVPFFDELLSPRRTAFVIPSTIQLHE